MKQTTQNKLAELQRLIREKEEIEKKIEMILEPEKIIAPPANFNLTNEIVKVVQIRPQRISTDEIFEGVIKNWPDLNIPRRKVNSTIVYLKNKENPPIEQVERGVYRIVVTHENSIESEDSTTP